MLEVAMSAQFRRDLKLCSKRHKDLQLLQDVIDVLRIPDTLPVKYKDHTLTGNYAHRRECHIQPDWLLVYYYDRDRKVLYLDRTGSHSDLFR